MTPSLQTLCKRCILNNPNFYQIDLYAVLPFHLANEIYLEKHKQLMLTTFVYFDKINAIVNKNNDVSLCNIKYLVGEDFFSYDHLLVRYKFKNTYTFSFIQI